MTHTFNLDYGDDFELSDDAAFFDADPMPSFEDEHDDLTFMDMDDMFFEDMEEGDLFFKKLWRGAKKVAKAVAPVAKQLAPQIGKVVGGALGTAIGMPGLGASAGAQLGGFIQNLEADDMGYAFESFEQDDDTADEMDAEDFIDADDPDIALAEFMASAASKTQSAIDSAAMAGAIATAATAKSPMKIRAVAPVLCAANARAAKVMAQSPNSKVLIKTLPTITQKTVATLTKKAAKGKGVSAKTASRVMAKHAVKTLSQPKELAKALAKNQIKTRKLNTSAIKRAERFAM